MPLTRRQFLASTALGAASLVATGAGAVFYDTVHLETTRLEIPLRRLPAPLDGLRIVQLSDFHYDTYLDNHVIASAVRVTNELQPDVVVLTGDFVTQGFLAGRYDPSAARDAEPCAQLLADLHPRLGTFAILGNHDYYTDPNLISEILRAHRIHVLRNQCFPLERDGRRLWLVGLDDVLGGLDDLGMALQPVPASEATVLLVHEPDYADWVPADRVDLQLSGHSHGGQIVLPVIGPPYLPPLARKYPWGLRKIGSLALYTNRGLGTITLPMRYNSPPEITLFTLKAAPGS